MGKKNGPTKLTYYCQKCDFKRETIESPPIRPCNRFLNGKLCGGRFRLEDEIVGDVMPDILSGFERLLNESPT